MKLRIQDREYPLITPDSAHLLHLMELKAQSVRYSPDGKGLGMSALQKMRSEAAERARRVQAARDAGEDVPDAEEDADAGLMWLGVLAFLTRRAAGEDLTFVDAIDIPLSSIEAVPEEGDDTEGDGGEPDPTTPAPAGQATPDDAPADAAA